MLLQISLSCLLVLEGQMNKQAVESEECCKILEQMAPFGIAWLHTPGKESDAPYTATPHKSGATSAPGQMQTQTVGCCGAVSP